MENKIAYEELEKRIIELENKLEFDKLISSIVAIFSEYDDNDIAINKFLQTIGQFFHADRSSIFLINNQKEIVNCEYEWCSDGTVSQIKELQKISLNTFSGWMENFKNQNSIIFDIKEELPEANPKRAFLENKKIDSIIALSIKTAGNILGFIVFDNIPQNKIPTAKIQKAMRVGINIMGNIFQFKKANEELKENEDKYRFLNENSKDIVALHAQDSEYLYVSPSVKNILGYEPQELIGTKAWKLVHPIDLQNIAKQHKKNKEDKLAPNKTSTYRIRHKNGEYLWFESLNQIIKDKDGNVKYGVSSTRDVTERKIAEEKLKESETKYRLIIENSNDAIIILQENKIVFSNNSFSKMFGFTKDELLNADMDKFLTKTELQNIESNMEKLSIKEIDGEVFEINLHRKDQSKIIVEVTSKVIDFNGQISIFAFIRDITKHKEIIEVLKKAAVPKDEGDEFIAICAACSKIRDDNKEDKPWLKPAEYFTERFPHLKFSHSMCPECAKEWYGDFYKEIKKEKKISK